jgi:hypothetical protein
MGTGWILHPGYGFAAELADETPAMDAHFPGRHGHQVTTIPAGSTVVPRFRVLPFARELDDDVTASGSRLVNSFAEHRFAADLGAWYPVFEDLTPATWTDVAALPPGEPGPFVVKGETNSRRQLWTTHCFASDRSALGPVIANLNADSLIGSQRLFIRRFEPMASYGRDVVGMPVSDEYRVFYLDGFEVARGFYWANHLADLVDAGHRPDPGRVDDDLLVEVGYRLDGRIRFAAVDVARTESGRWIVVEVNDGSMAGLCGVSADELFGTLAALL